MRFQSHFWVDFLEGLLYISLSFNPDKWHLNVSFCVLQVYQSLDHELQRHVSLQDTLQQCQTWLTSVSEEPEPPAHPPLSLEEALQQVSKPLHNPKQGFGMWQRHN